MYAVDVGQWRHSIGNYNFTDDAGAQAAFTIYTVTGDVALCVVGLCKVLMDSGGAATIELGISGNTAALIAQTTATDLDAHETWQDAVPEVNPGIVDLFGGSRQFVVANGADVIMTIATADMTAGDLDFHAFWMPLSTDGAVAAA
jgi:riboflavin synthase